MRHCTVIQRAQAIHASLKADVQMQVGRIGRMLLQHRKRNVVAGPHGEQLMALVPRVGQNVARGSDRSASICGCMRVRARRSAHSSRSANCVGRARWPCDQMISGSPRVSSHFRANPRHNGTNIRAPARRDGSSRPRVRRPAGRTAGCPRTRPVLLSRLECVPKCRPSALRAADFIEILVGRTPSF